MILNNKNTNQKKSKWAIAVLPLLLLMSNASSAQNVRGIDHIGLTVPNIEDATNFLSEALGAKVLYDVLPKGSKAMEGSETEQQLGLSKGAKVVHMRLLQIGNSATVEMFEFQNTGQANAAIISDYGYQHLAFYVDDIISAVQKFQKAGGMLLSEVHGLAGVEEGKNNKGVYGRTPWGSLVELITYPDGLKDKKLHRYTPRKKNLKN